LINNYLSAIASLVKKKYGKSKLKSKFDKICNDLSLKNYYLFSAVFIGALIRLLRHFLSKKDKAFNIVSKLDAALKNGEDDKKTINLNIQNEKLMNLFKSAFQLIVDKYKFTRKEFNQQEGWGSNKWAKIESDLFYLIKDKYKNFGDETLIPKKHRRKKFKVK